MSGVTPADEGLTAGNMGAPTRSSLNSTTVEFGFDVLIYAGSISSAADNGGAGLIKVCGRYLL